MRYTLECEGVASPTDAQVAAREALTRSKITRLLRVDAHDAAPLPERYPTVVSAYCADSATDDRGTWEAFMRNISGLVAPGGVFLTSALRRCGFYVVGGKRFPSANVDEDDVRAALAGFGEAEVVARTVDGHEALGYSGIVLAWANGPGCS